MTNYTASDFIAGDVLVYTGNPGSNGMLSIVWTAPQAGTITYSGNVWYAHSSVNWSNDSSVDYQGFTVLRNFSGALAVNAGDILALRFTPTAGQPFGSLATPISP